MAAALARFRPVRFRPAPSEGLIRIPVPRAAEAQWEEVLAEVAAPGEAQRVAAEAAEGPAAEVAAEAVEAEAAVEAAGAGVAAEGPAAAEAEAAAAVAEVSES